MGIDDFAFRKGHTYGTLVCDLTTHKPVAVLPNRKPNTITSWLKKHKHIKVVSRDGYSGFRQGISAANKMILQVYDRWHFIKNLKEQLNRYVLRSVSTYIQYVDSTPVPLKITKLEQEKHTRQTNKWKLIQMIQEAHRAGQSLRSLAKSYNLNRETVSNYIHIKSPSSLKKCSIRPHLIDPYLHIMIDLESRKYTVKQIEAFLRDKGYTGSQSAVTRRVAMIRRNRKKNQPLLSKEHQISQKQIARWMWKKAITLEKEEQNKLQFCFTCEPHLKDIYRIIQAYREIVDQANYQAFLRWLEELLTNKKHPFYQYACRLKSDLESIKHAFLLPYSNGVLEGQVNRLKALKRIMYGRASLSLLQKRILYQL
ncbi:hypothetical protein ShirakiTB12_54150 [Priestia megaterium]|uniref:Transposase IS204/IS1001/IS1096/IS1165 DDE domain-containing protein n=1 Tax=Priestia megaterium TaxID=1404 RepID=A0AAX6BT48_PRIMG|nr:hypothetical protein ShirakiTB12_53670 [Priestia megaterium]GMG76946.1 hypothetical protein ShirakiTB12_54150 [Priestia megaterium]